ncbi:maltose alpha-D-glucosyltransferase [Legionella genomosp. 1]|uniref:maltose alpha-D-glucosyltransferase n=1 Tax=Legionella genomosp. 1 TaxID=1093625 RepID=UPI001056A1D2|nr:maltose alpha-D-glucosyltransferase [Legionella genomosp. 1]
MSKDSQFGERIDWYKDAVIYQIHIRSFFDSNDDGIGDFQGLIKKLDYLKFLGINAVWLLPFYPSPLKDEGYDIADYSSINPIYGSLKDFKALLKEAHQRNIRIITELVINHTSNAHPWFQKSRRAKPGSYWRNFYTWSNDASEYADARIIFRDFETSNWAWDPVAKAYYWHRFYSHQPDLNYDNPNVQKEVFKIVDFWLNLGVDGLRLDAIPYLFQREGTSCENLPETHEFLKKLSAHVKQKFPNRLLLAEANQWPDDAVQYFGQGDECQMAFHFPLMPRMYMAVKMEDRFPLIDIIEQTPAIPENCQWAIFLRNHDELTLEMVTDEERDYMYRMYAQDQQMRINLGIRRRLAPLLDGDRRRIELLNAMLFSLPGTPIIYYGDEIGMGDNIYLGDRNGVRTPMQWSGDLNAGFSKATPQKLYSPVIIDPEYNYQAVNVELQLQNSHSLLWWMKRTIEVRNSHPAFWRGTIELLTAENPKILAFYRTYEEQRLLVLINLSKNIQSTFLDLSSFANFKLLEVFGKNQFPPIQETPYFFVLPAYGFLWLELQKPESIISDKRKKDEIEIKKDLSEIFEGKAKNKLETVLENYIINCRWYRSKNHKITKLSIYDSIMALNKPTPVYLLIILVEYKDKEAEKYSLFITREEDHHEISQTANQKVICTLKTETQSAYLVDAAHIPALWSELFNLFGSNRQLKGSRGKLSIMPNRGYKKSLLSESNFQKEPINAEQSNTSIRYNAALFKLYRRCETGINPEVEITELLMKKSHFRLPKILSHLQYEDQGKPVTLGIIQEHIPNEGDAWAYSINHLSNLLEEGNSDSLVFPAVDLPWHKLVPVPEQVSQMLGIYSNSIEKLAEKTAAMHIALAESSSSSDFKQEDFNWFDQRSLYQSLRSILAKAKKHVSSLKSSLEPELYSSLQDKLAESRLKATVQSLLNKRFNGKKIRCHGDFHLGQILYTGDDFIIIDYEGEPNRPLSERKIKRSPLKDIAGMLRSFHYAVYTVTQNKETDLALKELSPEKLYAWICQLYLGSYLNFDGIRSLLPADEANLLFLLKIFMLEKVLYEIEYEINNRPDWVHVPCKGLIALLE